MMLSGYSEEYSMKNNRKERICNYKKERGLMVAFFFIAF